MTPRMMRNEGIQNHRDWVTDHRLYSIEGEAGTLESDYDSLLYDFGKGT